MDKHIKLISHGLTLLGFFLLPWQTVWIVQQRMVGGHVWQYGSILIYLSEVVLWVAMVGWLVVKWRSKEYTMQSCSHIGVMVTLGLVLLALKQSSDIAVTIQGLSWIFLSFWVAYILFHARSLSKYIQALGVSLMLVSLLALTQFAHQVVFPSSLLGIAAQFPEVLGVPVVVSGGERLLRAFGSFPHPNILGGYMVFGVALALYTLKDRSSQRFGRALYVLSLIGLLISFSRSAWLSFIILMAIYLYQHDNPRIIIRKISSLTIAVIAVFIILYHPYIANRIQPQHDIEQRSINERKIGFAEALEVMRQYPFGTGVHNYTVAVSEVFPERVGYELQPVHNTLLLIVVEWGIGVLLLLAALLYAITHSRYTKQIFFSFLIVSPVLMLDHYMWSLYAGIMLFGIMMAINVHFLEHKN